MRYEIKYKNKVSNRELIVSPMQFGTALKKREVKGVAYKRPAYGEHLWEKLPNLQQYLPTHR